MPSPSQTSQVAVGQMAIVKAGQLRQVADPNRPTQRTFESPGPVGFERVLVPLGENAHVRIVGGPTNPNGDVYWQVADAAFPGCCAPFGWVRATQTDNEPAIVPLALDCPDRAQPMSGDQLIALGVMEAATCFGPHDFALRGIVRCSQPAVDSYLSIAGPQWTDDRTLCVFGDALDVYGPAVTALFAQAKRTDNGFFGTVDMKAHFNDASSVSCRWAHGTLNSIDISDDAPADTAQFACAMSIYVTQATPQP
jgi:hypothetical protein